MKFLLLSSCLSVGDVPWRSHHNYGGRFSIKDAFLNFPQIIILNHSKQLISCVYGGLKSQTIWVSALYLISTLILFWKFLQEVVIYITLNLMLLPGGWLQGRLHSLSTQLRHSYSHFLVSLNVNSADISIQVTLRILFWKFSLFKIKHLHVAGGKNHSQFNTVRSYQCIHFDFTDSSMDLLSISFRFFIGLLISNRV